MSEPTIADVLAAIGALQSRVDEGFERAGHGFEQLNARVDQVAAAVGQLRADIAAVKVDTGYIEAHVGDQQEAIRRHVSDPNAHRRAA